MPETAKYCSACINGLSPATAKTQEEKEFLAAHTFDYGSTVDYERGPKTLDGTCDKCGKKAVLTYYLRSN